MIRGQRVGHRRAFAVLAVALPAFLVAALRARPAEIAGLAVTRAAEPGGDALRIVREGPRVHLRLPRDWNEPDVLLYASPSWPAARGLPADARLVGSLEGSRSFAWPDGPGTLALLYSLAQDRVLLAVEPEEEP